MTKVVKIKNIHEINWPVCCAKCNASTRLTLANTTSGRVTGISPLPVGAVTIKSDLLNMDYPVCQRHSKGLDSANFLTRNTIGFKFLRGLIYYFGGMGALLLLTLPVRLFRDTPSTSLPGGLVFIFAFSFIALIYLRLLSQSIPLTTKQNKDDSVTIKFRNDQYAEKFKSMNKDNLIG